MLATPEGENTPGEGSFISVRKGVDAKGSFPRVAMLRLVPMTLKPEQLQAMIQPNTCMILHV